MEHFWTSFKTWPPMLQVVFLVFMTLASMGFSCAVLAGIGKVAIDCLAHLCVLVRGYPPSMPVDDKVDVPVAPD